MKTQYDFKDPLAFLHPLVREWFITKLGQPTEPQIQGWPSILSGQNTLISAPTGSGKTLSAFMICLNRLVENALSSELSNKTEVLYISPLKALGNDIQVNLMDPLREIDLLAKARGLSMQEIQVAVRSGDTPPKERQQMLKKRPHMLITTPESFYILLTAEKSRELLADVRTVIVDEIHALMNSKRGSHLSLSLERLEALTPVPPIRIGLSATQKPIERVARYLVGPQRHLPQIVNIGHIRPFDLSVSLPNTELGPIASNESWDEIYDKIAALTQTHRSTLVFVNTRRLSERVAHHLRERLGEDAVAAHHGSLSKKIRQHAESRLKRGELKVLVATASLELGIDIGTIDVVCQIGSPRAINIALQRIGRSGHCHAAISKGIFFATTRDELFECAALIYAIKKGEVDELIYPKEPLDILAQQIVATVAAEEWEEKALFKLIKKAFPYASLSEDKFNTLLDLLSEGVAGSRGRFGAYLLRDRVNGLVKARRGARLTAITSGGAIPENALFTVILEPDGITVGTLDEDFAVESNRGDIILLGTTSWKILRIEAKKGQVIVENAYGAPPSVPFWRGEAEGRTKELSFYVSLLRETLDEMLPRVKPSTVELSQQPNSNTVLHWLKENCALEPEASTQLVRYILEGRAVLGALPTQKTIIAERFFDETGGMQLILHAPFGNRINKAWGLALRKKFCRSFNFELQAAATDDGLNISLAEQHSFPLADVFHFLNANTLKEVLIQAVLQSPLFTTRWRWTATRSLSLVRFRQGRKVPPNIQRVLSDDLLAAVFPDAAACQDNLGGRDIELPDHPLIEETMKDALAGALDLEGLCSVIQAIKNNEIKCLAVDTPVPSVFSNEILNANPYAFLDDAPLEERRARAVEMRRMLPDSVLEEVGKLDPDAILEVQQQAWPDIRNPDELHDALQTLIVLPEPLILPFKPTQQQELSGFFEELLEQGRAGIALFQNKRFWFATEKRKALLLLFPSVRFLHDLKEIQCKLETKEEAILAMVRGWMTHLGPITLHELSELLCLEVFSLQEAMLRLENSGFVLRGKYRQSGEGATEEWCERRLLARIHRLTISILRKEIAPVSLPSFMKWLFRWQHAAPKSELTGEAGLLEVVRQLQGVLLPANVWEKHIFSKRVKDYTSDLLDRLCLTGVISWGRPSKTLVNNNTVNNKTVNNKNEFNKKRKNKLEKELEIEPLELTPHQNRKINPTSNAPITFFVTTEFDYFSEKFIFDELLLEKSSYVAKKIYPYLKEKGASFIAQISKNLHHLESEIERGLWELVTLGAITADSFDNLRAFIDPKRRLNKGHRRRPLFQLSKGRWSLLSFVLPHQDLEENNNIHANDENHEKHQMHDQKMEAVAKLLLKRYGVVFRDLLYKEKMCPSWRELLNTFRRLEDRGEIRGGRFVEGFLGEQFALPLAVDSLRNMRNQDMKREEDNTKTTENKNRKTEDQIVSISSYDPLNFIGILFELDKKLFGNQTNITFKNGEPLINLKSLNLDIST